MNNTPQTYDEYIEQRYQEYIEEEAQITSLRALAKAACNGVRTEEYLYKTTPTRVLHAFDKIKGLKRVLGSDLTIGEGESKDLYILAKKAQNGEGIEMYSEFIAQPENVLDIFYTIAKIKKKLKDQRHHRNQMNDSFVR